MPRKPLWLWRQQFIYWALRLTPFVLFVVWMFWFSDEYPSGIWYLIALIFVFSIAIPRPPEDDD